MAKPTLRDEILSAAAPRRYGFPAWHEKLPPDALAELEAIRADWHAGKLGLSKWTLSTSISKSLTERGLPSAGPGEIVKWLARKSR
jgi:hypothetical protein